ncbi:MAG: alpha/beta hydrolase [Novosphingobium sp.]|nr:alpha/beta hydrolase [Novosphingobium sp.]
MFNALAHPPMGAARPRRSAQTMPRRWLGYAELPRAMLALASIPLHGRLLRSAPKGDRGPVLVIPGFATTDRSTFVLRRYLSWLGYDVHGWGLGRNLGAKTIGLHNERLIARLGEVHRRSRRKVRLIGWSMGGIMARMISREMPQAVLQIVCLGAPFSGDPFANNVWKIYERLSGHSLSHPIAQQQIARSKFAPPVPSTSLYSRSDGVVSWRSCLEPPAPGTANIQVQSAHCGFGFDPRVLRTVADRLALQR